MAAAILRLAFLAGAVLAVTILPFQGANRAFGVETRNPGADPVPLPKPGAGATPMPSGTFTSGQNPFMTKTKPGEVPPSPGMSIDLQGRPCNMSGTNPPISNVPRCR